MSMPESESGAAVPEEVASSPFAHFVAAESIEVVRRLIGEAAALVGAYSSCPIGSPKRIDVVLSMTGELAPIVFNSRLEPRATIASAWREAAEFASSQFFEAVDGLLRREDSAWGRDQIRVLLELLVETGLTVPPATAFLAQERLKLDFDRKRSPLPLASLMSLVPNSGGAISSMLERLRNDGMLGPAAVQAAVRKVARWDPDNLELFLSLFGEALFSENEDLESVQFFVTDLIERAGPDSVMRALSGIDPGLSPALISAAFGGSDPPYSIELQLEGREPDLTSGRALIRQGHRVLPRTLLRKAAQDSEWLLKVRLAKGVMPIMSNRASTFGADDEFEIDEDFFLDEGLLSEGVFWEERVTAEPGEGRLSMSQEFAMLMGVRIAA